MEVTLKNYAGTTLKRSLKKKSYHKQNQYGTWTHIKKEEVNMNPPLCR
jgi:hypothetical protein